jgi:urease accessory protein
MKMPTAFSRTALFATAFALLPALAHAHPGHDAASFSSGIAHPMMGFDHLLAIVAVGLLAVQIGGRALWALPGAFICMMMAGGVIGMSSANIPFMEHGIVASIFILGVLIATAARFSVVQSSVLVGMFALLHGLAHGVEAPVGGGAAYVCGFALSTALLHLCGISAGLALRGTARTQWLRLSGVAIIAGGVFAALS